MPTIVVQLRPAGPGGSFRERLEAAVLAASGEVRLRVTAVVVELEPVEDERPEAVKYRRALKRIRRDADLAADWNVPPTRPKPNAGKKPNRRKA